MRRLLLAIGLSLGLAGLACGDWSGGSWQASGAASNTSNGGTGLTSIGSANQVLGVNNGATALEYKTISGTANQVTVTQAANSVTLSAPQDLATTSAPSFAGLTVVGNLVSSSASVVDAYNLSFGAVTAGSTSTLTWTEVTDRLSEFVTSSFTAITAGYYQITADAGASQTAGTGCLLIKVNGTTIIGGDQCQTGATALLTIIPVAITRILNLSASDIVRVDASATTANTTFVKLHLSIHRVP